MTSRLVVDQIEGSAGSNNIITVPSGHTFAAPGHILQVQTAICGPAPQTISSLSPVAVTGLSISFTPKFSTSKIILTASLTANWVHVAGAGFFKNGVALGNTSGYTNNNEPNLQVCTYLGTGTTDYIYTQPIMWFDTAGSTDTRTYAVYATSGWSGTTYSLVINNRGSNDMATQSSMMIMEVAQ